jgi:hypothetical protein
LKAFSSSGEILLSTTSTDSFIWPLILKNSWRTVLAPQWSGQNRPYVVT